MTDGVTVTPLEQCAAYNEIIRGQFLAADLDEMVRLRKLAGKVSVVGAVG